MPGAHGTEGERGAGVRRPWSRKGLSHVGPRMKAWCREPDLGLRPLEKGSGEGREWGLDGIHL